MLRQRLLVFLLILSWLILVHIYGLIHDCSIIRLFSWLKFVTSIPSLEDLFANFSNKNIRINIGGTTVIKAFTCKALLSTSSVFKEFTSVLFIHPFTTQSFIMLE